MIPVRLQLINFMNHINSDIDCVAFKTALIVGKNKNNERESNGIGKTTIFYAIEYVLFGQAPTDLLDEIVRDGEDKCEVIFDFKMGDSLYRILRGRSSKGRSELRLWEWVENDWVSISARSMPETSKKIQEIIKISHKAFIYSVRYAQNDITQKDWTGDPADRQSILKEPLYLSPYTKLEKIANQKRLKVQKNIDIAEALLQSLGRPEDDQKTAEIDLKYYTNIIATHNADAEKYRLIISEKQSLLNDLKKTIDSSDTGIHDTIAELNRRGTVLAQNISKTKKTIADSKATADDNRNNLNLSRQKLDALKKDLETECAKDLRKESIVKTELSNVSDDELYGVQLLAKLRAEYDAANKSIPNGDFCSHCSQPITVEHREKCEKEITAVLAQKSIEISDLEKNLAKCRKKKIKLNEELADVIKINSRIVSIENEINKLNSHTEIYTKNEDAAIKRWNESKLEFDNFQKEYDEVSERLESLKQAAKASSFNETNEKILKLNDEIKAVEHNLEENRHLITEAHSQILLAQEKIKTSKENIEKFNEQKKQLNLLYNDLAVHQLVINSFSQGGIPTFIIYSILDEFQLEINKILQMFRPELGVQLDKYLNIFYSVSGKNRSYKQLSGGQKVYVLFSLKMGLARVIQRKIGVDIRLIQLDEVDQSLDEAGLEAFTDIIKKLQDEFKIFIITHNRSLKEKFSHAILVEGDTEKGASSRVVTNW